MNLASSKSQRGLLQEGMANAYSCITCVAVQAAEGAPQGSVQRNTLVLQLLQGLPKRGLLVSSDDDAHGLHRADGLLNRQVFDLSQLIDSTKSLKSSKASKAEAVGTKSVQSAWALIGTELSTLQKSEFLGKGQSIAAGALQGSLTTVALQAGWGTCCSHALYIRLSNHYGLPFAS